jgi:hypothetical protein
VAVIVPPLVAEALTPQPEAVRQLVVMVVPPLVLEVKIPQMIEMATLPAAELMTPLMAQAV